MTVTLTFGGEQADDTRTAEHRRAMNRMNISMILMDLARRVRRDEAKDLTGPERSDVLPYTVQSSGRYVLVLRSMVLIVANVDGMRR